MDATLNEHACAHAAGACAFTRLRECVLDAGGHFRKFGWRLAGAGAGQV